MTKRHLPHGSGTAEKEMFRKGEWYKVELGARGFGIYEKRVFDKKTMQWIHHFRSVEEPGEYFSVPTLKAKKVRKMDKSDWQKFQNMRVQNQNEVVLKYKLSITDRTILLFKGRQNCNGAFPSSRIKNSLEKLMELGLVKAEGVRPGIVNYVLTAEGAVASSSLFSSSGAKA